MGIPSLPKEIVVLCSEQKNFYGKGKTRRGNISLRT